MKNNYSKKVLKIFFSLFLLAFITSCTKDQPATKEGAPSILQLRNNPTIINGMISFSDYTEFETYISALETAEQDTNSLKAAYASFGINVNDTVISNLTDNPICLQTENSFSGFTSARETEETQINSSLNSGIDIFSMVDKPYLKTVLNSDNSVHIGTRIFKYYPNGGICIILNNDWTTYKNIKTLPYDSLRQLETNNVLVTSESRDNWGNYYNASSANGDLGSEKVVVYPDLVETPLACYFSDKVIVTHLNDNTIRFEIPFTIQSGEYFQWIFSDGQTATGNPVTKSFTSGGYVNIVYYLADGGVKCRAYVPFDIKCGDKKSTFSTLDRTVNGQRWKIDASMWVISGQVGCRMKYLRKIGLFWLPAFNEAVCTDISGTYKKTKACSSESVYGTKCLGAGTYPTSISFKKNEIVDLFVDPGNLSSGHIVKVKGTWFGFGLDGVPRLVLN
ncbi:MAG TPA: hypothetical protein PK076_04955 [Saprospiraceae bacterium]|nr:hypothetical protein [Saprospiraceae bacterium]HQW55449.1 hypothetical protein [Saprospiraceae bacterium]